MALLAILVMLALVLQADPGQMRDLLGQMDLTIIIAVVGLYLLNVFTKVLRWYALLTRGESTPPIGKVTLYFLIGMAINNSTPGRVSGEPVRAYLVKTGSDYPMGRGMASIFVEKTIDTIVTLTFAIVGTLLLMGVLSEEASDTLLLSAGIVAIIMAVLLGFIAFPGVPRRLASWFFRRLNRRGPSEQVERWEGAMDGFLGTFEQGTHEIARNPVQTSAATGLTVIIWFNEALRLWLVFLALGYNASFELMMIATSLASFAALLIPLGAGSSTAIAAICTLAGIDGTLSTTAGLVFVMTSIWISIPLGAGAMAISGVRGKEVLGMDRHGDGNGRMPAGAGPRSPPDDGALPVKGIEGPSGHPATAIGAPNPLVATPPSDGRVASVTNARPDRQPSVLHVPDGDDHEGRPDPLLLNEQH